MSGAWENRVIVDEKGHMYFASVRFRVLGDKFEETPSGFAPAFLDGKNIAEMRDRAMKLVAVCDRPPIKVAEIPDLGQRLQREIVMAIGSRDVKILAKLTEAMIKAGVIK